MKYFFLLVIIFIFGAVGYKKKIEIINQKNPNLENKEEVASAVGVGAVVFHDLSNNRIKDVNFMWDEVLNFDGNTGPYVQYTYARCCGVLEKNPEIAEKLHLSLSVVKQAVRIVSEKSGLPRSEFAAIL